MSEDIFDDITDDADDYYEVNGKALRQLRDQHKANKAKIADLEARLAKFTATEQDRTLGMHVRDDAEALNEAALEQSYEADQRARARAANPYGSQQNVAGLPPAGIRVTDAINQARDADHLRAILANAHLYQGGTR